MTEDSVTSQFWCKCSCSFSLIYNYYGFNFWVSLAPKFEIQSGNLSKEWKQWRQVWDAYEEVTDLQNKTNWLHVATFITQIGKETLEVHNGLPFASDEEKSNMTKVLELWETHCIGKTNIIYET